MSIKTYILSKGITLCFIGIAMMLLAIIMMLTESSLQMIIMAEILVFVPVALWLVCVYVAEDRRMKKLEKMVSELDDKYLLGEVLPRPVNAVERQYYDIMKTLSCSAIGVAEDAVREKEEYRDYVESWIHEIKTPLTACSLILDNDGDVRKLRRELKRADNLTESILYYARMRTIEKDTQIRECSVAQVMDEAVKSQMEILIAAGISIEVRGDFKVYTDSKSLLFIFKQLLINCGKYCPGCQVKMVATAGTETMPETSGEKATASPPARESTLTPKRMITVEDNGSGIPAHELGRVTDRGFSGTNGRKHGKSTGMGLYIVKELCRQMNVEMKIESEEGKYTRVILTF